MEVWSGQAELDLDPLIFTLLILVQSQINICSENAWVKEGQLLELLLDEIDQTLGLL